MTGFFVLLLLDYHDLRVHEVKLMNLKIYYITKQNKIYYISNQSTNAVNSRYESMKPRY